MWPSDPSGQGQDSTVSAASSRLGAKGRETPSRPSARRSWLQRAVPWDMHRQQETESSAASPHGARVRVGVRDSPVSPGQGDLAEQMGPWQDPQVPGHMPCLLMGDGL